jgi:hypothetical protein
MNSYAIASDLSYEVFQLRARRGELAPCALDSVNRRLYPLPSQVVQREAFVADRQAIRESFQGERAFARECDVVRLPHVRRRERK